MTNEEKRPYEFVDGGMVAQVWFNRPTERLEMINRLWAEREAYRSVAYRLAADYTTADFDVEAEARKIIEGEGRDVR